MARGHLLAKYPPTLNPKPPNFHSSVSSVGGYAIELMGEKRIWCAWIIIQICGRLAIMVHVFLEGKLSMCLPSMQLPTSYF